MKLTLVRHAEVEEKYHKKYNGHNKIALSTKGKVQAKELCKRLNDLEFDSIYCSDLPRAKETIKYFKHKEQIVYTNRLREKSWGKHEGLSFDEIIAQGEIKYENFLQWIDALDGEDYEKYVSRIKEFFLVFLPSINKDNILIVTHAGVIRVLLSILKKIKLEDAFSIKIDYGELIIENI